MRLAIASPIFALVLVLGCSSPYTTDPQSAEESTEGTENATGDGDQKEDTTVSAPLSAEDAMADFEETLGHSIDLDDLPNYVNQTVPDYVNVENGDAGASDEIATLGRVLFYDVALSSNDSTSCSSCHQQAFAFGDPEVLSTGAFGTTGRHSMRLVNARFAQEERFFWDERAETLEQQSTMPIRDHAEMGFSGGDGDPSFEELIVKLSGRGYYQVLFTAAYGDEEVSEARMQEALAAFVRSIQSFDSRYDEELSSGVPQDADFPGFTAEENLGKRLFLAPPGGVAPPGAPPPMESGAGCGGCHRAPLFDIDPDSGSNGFAGDGGEADDTVTRSPTLRDVFAPGGDLNGPLMHNGLATSLEDVVAHYERIVPQGRIDPRLDNGGQGQQLNLTDEERAALVAFMRTLGGTAVYTDERLSDPF